MKKFLAALGLALVAGGAVGQDLTVWTTFDGRTLDYLRSDVADFGAAFALEVEVVPLGVADIETRMLASAAEGGAGDVVVGLAHDQVVGLATNGVLADLGDFATSDYLADLGQRARLAFTHGDELLGLPMFVEGPALVYNRALIEEIPSSYEDFLDQAVAATGDGRYGFLFDIENFYFAFAWFETFGGYVFGREDGRLQPDDVGLASEGAVRGAQALQALRFRLGLIPADMSYEGAHRLFNAGAVAAIYTGPWAVAPAREAGVDVAVTAMPPLADGTPWSGFMSVQGVSINAFSERPADAVNLAKWIARDDAQLDYAADEGRIPASRAALERASEDRIVAGFGRALLDAEPLPNVPQMGRVWGAMARALDEILASEDEDVSAQLSRAVRSIRGD